MAMLGCVAESLAVALEWGGALSAEGMDTVLLLGAPEQPMPEAAAVVVVAPPDGIAACDALLAAGARQIVQAVAADFDPVATGRLADALVRRLQVGFAPIAPADPSRGRSVYLGHLFIGSAPAPGEANLPRRLAAGTDEPVGLIPFRVVEEGTATIRAEMSRMAEWGRRYAVVDALTDAHLRALAEASRAQALLIGAAGLAPGIAGNFPRTGSVTAPPRGPGAVLVGSAARETLSQAGLARLYAPTFDLQAGEEARDALDWAVPRLSEEAPVVITTSRPFEVVAEVARGLVASGVTRLLVAGEEACEAVIAALGPRVLRLGAETDPGLPWCAVEGSPLHLLLKPGTAGARDIMLRAFEQPD